MGWRTRKDGKKYFKKPRTGYTSEPPKPPKKPAKVYFSDDHDRKRQNDFAEKRKDDFKKRQKAKKKQERINRVFNLNLGHAKGFLITATPVLVQLDPNLSAAYASYKVGKYGYCFLKKVNEDYKISGDFEESLKTVAKEEVEKKITSKIKSLPLQKGSQYAANRVWTFCKETYSDGKIDPRWDKFAESALTKSFEEIGGKLL